MTVLKKLTVLMIVLLSLSLKSYSQNKEIVSTSTGKLIEAKDSITVENLRLANIAIIERDYFKRINKAQDSVITLNKVYISEQDRIIKDFQNNLHVSITARNDLELKLNDQRRKTSLFRGLTASAFVGFILTLILK